MFVKYNACYCFMQSGCYEVFGKSVGDRLEVLIPILAGTFILQVNMGYSTAI